MILLTYIAAVLIGIALGLIGGGGSVLTVPVLVYLFGVDPVSATAYSLFIVGSTALVGAAPKFRAGLVNVKTAIVFGIPSIAAVYATRAFIVPHIPDVIYHSDHLHISKSALLMLLFALLMLAASVSMIRKTNPINDAEPGPQRFNYPLITVEGIVVGVLTGLVGAGGGFLIIPALVLLSRLPMKEAVGTSLVIISSKSLIGFTGDLGHTSMDWPLLLSVTSVAILGIFIGNALSKKINGDQLKQGFGWFVLIMGAYIIVKEIFFPVAAV